MHSTFNNSSHYTLEGTSPPAHGPQKRAVSSDQTGRYIPSYSTGRQGLSNQMVPHGMTGSYFTQHPAHPTPQKLSAANLPYAYPTQLPTGYCADEGEVMGSGWSSLSTQYFPVPISRSSTSSYESVPPSADASHHHSPSSEASLPGDQFLGGYIAFDPAQHFLGRGSQSACVSSGMNVPAGHACGPEDLASENGQDNRPGSMASSPVTFTPKPRYVNVVRTQVATDRMRQASDRRRNAEQRFECNVEGCGGKFTKNHNLENHLRAHSNERPYKCSKCQQPFARASDRSRHERKYCREAGSP